MSVVYQLAVSAGQADSYLQNGLDFFGGFAVDANEVAQVTEVGDLISLLNADMAGSPFSPDKPIDILQVPANPFIQTRLAVGPLHEQAFMGGVVEHPPFNGSGIAQAAGVRTQLMWVEPTRLTTGSRLWRFFPGSEEPELRGVYHGIAWGWETVKTGNLKACIPSVFTGPILPREWGILPVEVELDEGTSKPVALTMVTPGQPRQEEGFEELPTGLWAKRIAYHEDLNIFEHQDVARYRNIPVRVIRAVTGKEGKLMAHIVSLAVDAPLAQASGFSRYAQGTNTLITSFDDLTDRASREARPNTWDVSSRPAVTLKASRTRDNSDAKALMADIFGLLTNVAPTGWSKLRLYIQLVGQMAHFAASVAVPNDEEEASSEEEASTKDVTINLLPTAILHYVGQLKKVLYREEVGAPYVLVFEFDAQGQANVTINLNDEPRWAHQVPAQVWSADLKMFPRSQENIPQWLAGKTEEAQTEDQ
ncbi:hypothetical protein VR010_13665 [Actinomycetaceae bacterium L2_0104]